MYTKIHSGGAPPRPRIGGSSRPSSFSLTQAPRKKKKKSGEVSIKKIAIVGPESTGKTTLSKMIAAHYKTITVPEYAREYIAQLNRPYGPKDLLPIAKGQIQLENQLLFQASKVLVCDTNMTVMKIWSEQKYGFCAEWILNVINSRYYDHHFVCTPDMPWDKDPLRENPNNRDELFQLYINEMEKQQVRYTIVKGTPEERLQQVIDVLDKFVLKKPAQV
ncbi:MAG TPA: ATP-binding protein [Bacteroidia bacterium]|nr:ATP-binding protein [Bacteroidota bacterium]MBL0054102.1 ATP-binding protein [Bacteroidota bacterium]HRC32267.1 ATP-binding protein [Bacteroidia bacterium]